MPTQDVLKIVIEYGFDEDNKHTHTQHIQMVDESNPFGSAGMDLNIGTDAGYVISGYHYIKNYLQALHEICIPNIQILSATAYWLQGESFEGNFNEIANQAYSINDWPPDNGLLGPLGPRGAPFFRGKQRIPATGHYGAIIWGYISGSWANLPKVFAPSQVNANFARAYNNLAHVSEHFDTYVAPTHALSTYLQYAPKSGPSSVVYFGITNG